jgi:hypothetical protein
MKKFMVIIACAFLIAGISVPVFAQGTKTKPAEAVEITKGSVVSIDAAKKEMVIKDEKTGTDKAFTISEKAVTALKVGDKVRVKTKPGSSVAEGVKTINNVEQKAK